MISSGCSVFSVVGVAVQCRVTGIRVKHGNELRLGIPIADVVADQLKVKNRSRQVSFEYQRSILNTVLTSLNVTGMSMCSGFAKAPMS